MRRVNRRGVLTRADWVLLAAMVALGAALLLMQQGGGAATVRVTGTDGFSETFDLGEDRTVEVPGPLGTTVVAVRDGAARVISSPCPQQICVRMGPARRAGEVIVCVPNGVVVELAGEGHGRVDAITR